MDIRKIIPGSALFGLALVYASCVPAPLVVAEADCTDLAGNYRSNDFGFTSLNGTLNESFNEGAFEVGFDTGLFDSNFSALGYDPLGFVDAPYEAEAGTLTFSKPLVDNMEPGVQTFECKVVDDDTFTLKSDKIGFDFDDDGVFEDAAFEGTFDAV